LPDGNLIGAYIRPSYIHEYSELLKESKAKYTWIAVPWGAGEAVEGYFNWKDLDSMVNYAVSLGMKTAFHIYSRSDWAVFPPPDSNKQQIPPSTFPLDTNKYYNFIYKLAEHFKGRVNRYFVEEEAHASDIYFSGTPEQYMQMLSIVYRAVKAADSSAIIEDSGISNAAIAALYAKDLYENGFSENAIKFLNEWYEHYSPKAAKGESIIFISEQDIIEFFNQPEIQRAVEWTNLLWGKYGNSKDDQQIHLFGPYKYIPAISNWIHSQMKLKGVDKPIESWEFGYGWDGAPRNGYNEYEHSKEIIKLFATAMGEGIGGLVQWQFSNYADQLGHPGLIDSLKKPRSAFYSFKILVEKISRSEKSSAVYLDDDVWSYKFEKNNKNIYVIWSDSQKTISLPFIDENYVLTKINGDTVVSNNKFLEVQSEPVFLEPVIPTEIKNDKLKFYFVLEQNFPNPFNSETVISYQLSVTGKVSLKIYDVLGNEISKLVNEFQSAGNYNVNFNGSNLSSGIYFYKLQAGNFVDVKK